MDVMQLIRASSVKKKAGISARACVEPSEEEFFGSTLVGSMASSGGGDIAHQYKVAESQTHSMNLYETRIASMQRAVAMYVMFHEMGKRCAQFWPNWSCGLLRYRMDRTHSIMRIATTASPVSGAEVRGRMHHLAKLKEWRMSCSAMARVTRDWQFHRMMAAHLRDSRATDEREHAKVALLPSFGIFGGGGADHKKNDGASSSRSGEWSAAASRRMSMTHRGKAEDVKEATDEEQGVDSESVFLLSMPRANDAKCLGVSERAWKIAISTDSESFRNDLGEDINCGGCVVEM